MNLVSHCFQLLLQSMNFVHSFRSHPPLLIKGLLGDCLKHILRQKLETRWVLFMEWDWTHNEIKDTTSILYIQIFSFVLRTLSYTYVIHQINQNTMENFHSQSLYHSSGWESSSTLWLTEFSVFSAAQFVCVEKFYYVLYFLNMYFSARKHLIYEFYNGHLPEWSRIRHKQLVLFPTE